MDDLTYTFKLVGQVQTYKEVWLRQTKIITQKGHNFLSDHVIALKFLQEFLEAVSLIVITMSLCKPSNL